MKTIQNLLSTPWAHGLFMAVGGAIATGTYAAIQTGKFDLKAIALGAASALVLYISKNMSMGSSASAMPPEIKK